MYKEKKDFKFRNISRKGQTDMANFDTLRMTKLEGGVVRVHTHSLCQTIILAITITPESGKASLTIRLFRRDWTETVLTNLDAP